MREQEGKRKVEELGEKGPRRIPRFWSWQKIMAELQFPVHPELSATGKE